MMFHIPRCYLKFETFYFTFLYSHESAMCPCLAHDIYLHESNFFLSRVLTIAPATFWQLQVHSAEDSTTYTYPESSLPVCLCALVCTCHAFDVVHCNQSANKLRWQITMEIKMLKKKASASQSVFEDNQYLINYSKNIKPRWKRSYSRHRLSERALQCCNDLLHYLGI